MRADAVANREAIVRAAVSLYADVGPSVSLRAVASRAGVGIGTLYRHFPDRVSLLRGVAEHVHARVSEAVSAYEAADPAVEAARRWRAFVTELVGLRLGRIIPQMAADPALLEDNPWLITMRNDGLDRLDGALSLAKAEGLVREEVDVTRFQVGLAQISRPLGRFVDEVVPGWQDWLVDTYLRGLRP